MYKSTLKIIVTSCIAFILLILQGQHSNAQGYKITVKIKGIENTKIQLGYYYEDKQYIVEEQNCNKKGQVTFSNKSKLNHGIYMIIIPADTLFFDFLVSNEQNFTIKTNKKNVLNNIKFYNSEENTNFYAFQRQIEKINKKISKLDSTDFANDSTKTLAIIEKSKKERQDLTKNFISNHPKSFFASLLNAMDAPADENADLWQKVNFAEPGLIRTPFFQNVIYTHFVRLNESSAKTIIDENNRVLGNKNLAPELKNYIMFKFLNFYRTNQRFGMNMVFVDLADRYFLNGNTDSYSDELLEIIKKQRDIFKASFIGEIAKNIKVANMNGDSISLHSVKSTYTLLYFWSSGCGHCKKISAFMKENYKHLQANGYTTFALNTNEKKLEMLQKYLKEKPVPWGNYHDFNNNSRFKEYFYAVNAPLIFVLNKQKKIIRILNGVDQIEVFISENIEE